jgi:hypothetical protein
MSKMVHFFGIDYVDDSPLVVGVDENNTWYHTFEKSVVIRYIDELIANVFGVKNPKWYVVVVLLVKGQYRLILLEYLDYKAERTLHGDKIQTFESEVH